jgi:Flp pilus assembly protein TadB
MATAIYISTLVALIIISLVAPDLVWWSFLAALAATPLWYYFRLRDAQLDKRGEAVADLEGDALGPRREAQNVDDGMHD